MAKIEKVQLLSGLPQTDWNETDGTKPSYLKNKPTTLAGYGITDAANATALTSHTENKNNPHAVTKSQVGLGNVDNTSDTDKPVSAAQAAAIADAKKAGTDAQTDVNALKNRVSTAETAISTLNGDATTIGSVKKQVADAVAQIVADAPDDYNTLKEISDWISGHASDASEMNSQITENKTNVSKHTNDSSVHITETERANWNAAKTHADSAHAPIDAEKNQNAFSNVVVGSTTIAADSATDTLTLVAGNNVTLTPDATNDKITIAATDTKYSAATTSAAGLMSAADKTKLDGITASADTVAFSASATSGNKVGTITINGTATDMYSPTQSTISGNAGSATKLATARTIALSTGATGTATSFDGSSNITIPVTSVKEAYLSWGGRDISGTFGALDAALIEDLSANRLAGLPASQVTFERSSNAGSTWTTYSGNANLTTTSGGASNANTTSSQSVNNWHRITINVAGYLYCELRKIAIYLSTDGAGGCQCKVEWGDYSSTTVWTTAKTVSVSGWSGWNIINVEKTIGHSTYGNTKYVRLTFSQTSVNSSYASSLNVSRIRFYSANCWNAPSTLASTSHVYSYDSSFNATFPANVYVSGGSKRLANVDEVLLKSGGTMTGALTLNRDQYDGNYAMDCANSNIIGVNALVLSDSDNGNGGEGIVSPRSDNSSKYDSISLYNGTAYLTVNGTNLQMNGGTRYRVHSDANLVNTTQSANAASYTTGGSSKFYAVQRDKNDKLGVYVPWTDTVYTHPDSHPASMITGLATVATSGSYSDLSDKPTIPTKANSFSPTSGNVPDCASIAAYYKKRASGANTITGSVASSITISHGLGAIPSKVLVSITGNTDNGRNYYVSNITQTSFKVSFYSSNTGASANMNTGTKVMWEVIE